MDKEKIIHDLAILYMQIEIKNNDILISTDGDMKDFVNEYNFICNKIRQEIN